MIKAIRKRTRPDNLKNQVRAGGQTFARRLYLYSVVGLFVLVGWLFVGNWFFLDAEGIVTKDRVVVAPDYTARVLAIHVKPGDAVRTGQPIATLQSREILDSTAELTTRRAGILSREAQIAARVETIRKILPGAAERRRRAIETQRQLAGLNARGLTTAPRLQEIQREFYEAEREESSLTTELAAIEAELRNIRASRKEVDALIEQVQATYNGGRILAPLDGTIGARTPHVGQVVKSGETLVDLYRGDMFVLAFVPIGRLYSLAAGDGVRASDGQKSHPARIERIETVTDSLPPEFQSSFRSVDRQQLFRVVFDEPPAFPIQAKVRVTGSWSPQALVSRGRDVVVAAGETVTGWLRFGPPQIATK